jgi:hypothetical protein
VEIELGHVYHNDLAHFDLRVVPTGHTDPEHYRYRIEAFPDPRGGWAVVWLGYDLRAAADQLAVYLHWQQNPAEPRT